MWRGFRGRPVRRIGSCRSRNGSMRHARGRRHRAIGGMLLRPRVVMRMCMTARERTRFRLTGLTTIVVTVTGILLLRECSIRTVLACMTCRGMYGSGLRTAGTRVTWGHRQTGARGPRGIVLVACCGAARGSTVRGMCVPRLASGTRPVSASTSTVSASPGRWIESWIFVSLPLVGVQGAGAPWQDFSSDFCG